MFGRRLILSVCWYSVDYTSEMDVAEASVTTYPARFHDRLVHRCRAIKSNLTRFIGKSRDNHGCRARFPYVTSTSLLSSCPS